MSRSYFTTAKIPLSFFPQKAGATVLLDGKPVTRREYTGPGDAKFSFQLIDQNGNPIGLWFDKKTKLLTMFDFPIFEYGGLWMRWAILKIHRRGVKKLPPVSQNAK